MSKYTPKSADPEAVFAALEPAALDRAARQAYARRRDVDLTRALTDVAPERNRSHAIGWRPRLNVRFGLTTVTAAALVVGGVAGVSLTRHGQTASPATRQSAPEASTAAAFLLTSADRVALVPAGTGTYWHTVERVYQWTPAGPKIDAKKPNAPHAYVAATTETWHGKNGRFHADTGLDPQVTFPTAADETAWKAAGSPPLSTVRHESVTAKLQFTIGGKNLTVEQLQALPTDPGALRSWLHSDWQADHANLDENSFIYETALDVLTTPTTSGTRAALYRVLAQLPGVRIVGTVHDPLGRAGTAIARDEITSTGDHQVRQLIIDPQTGALLANVVYANSSGTASPAFWQAWQSLGWTNQIG